MLSVQSPSQPASQQEKTVGILSRAVLWTGRNCAASSLFILRFTAHNRQVLSADPAQEFIMRITSVLAISSLALFGIISAAETQTTPVPAKKLRVDKFDLPPPQKQDGERQLGLFDWLFESPTAGPATPAPITNTYDNDNDDQGFQGFAWTLGGDNTRN